MRSKVWEMISASGSRILGTTPVGRATVKILQINRPYLWDRSASMGNDSPRVEQSRFRGLPELREGAVDLTLEGQRQRGESRNHGKRKKPVWWYSQRGTAVMHCCQFMRLHQTRE
jgi:hypothetical protein